MCCVENTEDQTRGATNSCICWILQQTGRQNSEHLHNITHMSESNIYREYHDARHKLRRHRMLHCTRQASPDGNWFCLLRQLQQFKWRRKKYSQKVSNLVARHTKHRLSIKLGGLEPKPSTRRSVDEELQLKLHSAVPAAVRLSRAWWAMPLHFWVTDL